MCSHGPALESGIPALSLNHSSHRPSLVGMLTEIIRALSGTVQGDVAIAGWVRSRRDAKDFVFLEVNDGSCLRSIQVIVDREVPGWEEMAHITTGASVRVEGEVVASPAAGQKWEIR